MSLFYGCPHRALGSLLALGVLLACSDYTGPNANRTGVSFSASSVDLGRSLTGTVELHNASEAAVGPISIYGGPVTDSKERVVREANVYVRPYSVERLDPGSSETIVFTVDTGEASDGDYQTHIAARYGDQRLGVLEIGVHVGSGTSGSNREEMGNR